MTDNPLAGVSIPSLRDVIERAVDSVGIEQIDLGNPLQKRRLIRFLEESMTMSFESQLERAIEAATARAVTHVFRVMRDADYQEKKQRRLTQRRKEASERREKQRAAEREARMDYSKRKLEVSKATIQ